MADTLIRWLVRSAGILGETCVSTALATEGARRHRTSPLATIMLGRGLTTGALVGSLLKSGQHVAIKLSSNGPISKLLTESDSYGRVRGYCLPTQVDLASDGPAPGALGLFGNVGMLTVSKDLVRRGLTEGSVALQDGDIDLNLMHYFAQSEQISSLVRTGVLLDEDEQVEHAAGLLIQAVPGYDAAIWREVTDRLQRLPAMASWLADGHTPQEMLSAALGALDLEHLEERGLSFTCSCSRARSLQALKLLGRAELAILAAEGEAIVDCHFCHERYLFHRAELEELLTL